MPYAKWKVALGSLLAVVAAGLIAGVVFGFNVYREFFEFGPSDRPAELALDSVIESLNGFLRRTLEDLPADPGALDAILYAPYLALGLTLTVITLVIAWRTETVLSETRLAFSLITLLSLIVYPNTLYNTLPLMLPAIVVILSRSDRLTFDPRVTVSVVVVAYAITATRVVPGVYALLLVWVYLAVCLVAMDPGKTTAHSGQGTGPHHSVRASAQRSGGLSINTRAISLGLANSSAGSE